MQVCVGRRSLTSLVVPQDWIEPPTADDELYNVSSLPKQNGGSLSGQQAIHDSERPTSPLIAIPYVETQPLHIDVNYTGTRKDEQDP